MGDNSLIVNENGELSNPQPGDIVEQPQGKILWIKKGHEGVDLKGILARFSQYADMGHTLTHIEKLKQYVVQVPLQYQKALDEGKYFINQNQTTGVMWPTLMEIKDNNRWGFVDNLPIVEQELVRGNPIWDATRDFYHDHPQEKLLFIIDEAHMYRGSAGGEVALLIHRLMDKLDLDRSRFQFILTTASMPHESEADQKAVQKFACDLTSTERWESFVYLRGHQKDVDNSAGIPIDANMLASIDISRIDESETARLDELNNFIQRLSPAISQQDNMTAVSLWLYHHLGEYLPFRLLFGMCRGNAVALDELANQIFPGCENAMQALDTMLTIAPLAHDENGNVLFPARMHMLFRGFSGVYACMNEACPMSHEGNGIRLGDVFLSDNHLYCPHCHSHVFELYTDRRCGALFLHGFVSDVHGRQYLWRSKGAFYDEGQMKELHLYLPMAGDTLPAYKKGNPNGFKGQIVCYDRECCVLYKKELDRLLGEQTSTIVMDTNNDKEDRYKEWRRDRDGEAKVLDDFRDPNNPLQLVIVTSKLIMAPMSRPPAKLQR